MAIKHIIVLFVEAPRKFITAKLESLHYVWNDVVDVPFNFKWREPTDHELNKSQWFVQFMICCLVTYY
jgi:hypothetical protein